MKVLGDIFTRDGWERWEHVCTVAQKREIMHRVSELLKLRDGGSIAPTTDEYIAAADDVLRIRRGVPMHGDRYVNAVEFAPGETRYFG